MEKASLLFLYPSRLTSREDSTHQLSFLLAFGSPEGTK